MRALRATLQAELGEIDLIHLRRMQRWGRTATVLGLATAWIGVNPLAALALALGQSARWTMVAHHVLHRGYDRVPGVPERFRSAVFARGWRRWIDWPDWIHPSAWSHEHNVLHHFYTGETDDPDLVEHNAWLLRLRAVPRPLKWLLIGVLMLSWKLIYYAPNTFWAWREHLRGRRVDGRAKQPGAAPRARGAAGFGSAPRTARNPERSGGCRPNQAPSRQALRVPPVAFETWATMRWESASISSSVRVFSRGCTVTSTARDFLPSGTPLPW